ncbi:unnamed protein product [Blumeria hordei]|uniref:Uncharacterized protein n=1 Tax=Blumeria hordei TaxID=2867405 RepID=A0A383UUR5_BLUHO|nr:unnamed protein product [Blumeria hordei]
MTHILSPNQKFPEPDENIQIFKTPTTYRQAGTYFATYCSVDKTPSSIYQDIAQQLSEETGQVRDASSQNSEREESCFQHIKQKMEEMRSFSSKSVISTKNLENYMCSEELIVRLAYNWRITLIRGNKSRTNGAASRQPLVRLENAIEIRNYVENGQFISVGEMYGKRYALAWFEGHLHMFVWDPKGNMWELETSPNNVRSNGKVIINFLRATNPQIGSIMDNAYATMKEFRREIRNRDAHAQHEQGMILSHYNQKCRERMLEIEMMAAVPAHGFLRETF